MKKVNIIALYFIIVLIFTGCGSSEISLKEEKEEKVLHFSWWGSEDKNEATMECVKLFEKMYPEIKIKMDYGEWTMASNRFAIKMKSKTEADIMQISYHWLDTYSAYGDGFYDLSRLNQIIDFETFDENELATGVSGNIQNGVPTSMITNVFMFNQTILDSYGLTVPKTWDDLFSLAKVMKKDGVYPLSIDTNKLWVLATSYAEQISGKPIYNNNGTLSFSENEVKTMLEFAISMIDHKVIKGIDKFNMNDLEDGIAAGTVQWSNEDEVYGAKIGSENTLSIGNHLTMSGAKRSGWYYKPEALYAIKINSPYPEEAATFINFLLKDEQAVALLGEENGLSSSKITLDEDTFLMNPIFENEEIIRAFKNSIESVQKNKVNLNDASLTLFHEIKRILRNI